MTSGTRKLTLPSDNDEITLKVYHSDGTFLGTINIYENAFMTGLYVAIEDHGAKYVGKNTSGRYGKLTAPIIGTHPFRQDDEEEDFEEDGERA